MERNTQKKIQGVLTYLENIYIESVFQKSELHIDVNGNSESQNFYGHVPESILGKEVFLLQRRGNEELFQRLTIKEGKNIYQIRATSRVF